MTRPQSALRARVAPLFALLRRPRVRLGLKIAVGLVLTLSAVLTLRGLDLGAVWSHMGALPRTALFAGLGLSLVQAAALATRLWAVIPGRKRPSWGHVARAFGFGQFVNMYLPGRAGDVLKVVAIARHDQDAASGEAPRTDVGLATGVMLADKGLDVLTLALLAAVFGPGLALRIAAGAIHSAWIALVVVAGLAVVALVASRLWAHPFAKLRATAAAAVKTTRAMLTPRRMAWGVTLGLAAWCAEVVLMLVLCAGLGAPITFAQSVVALLVLNLGIAIPVSVANVGAYEAATVVGLSPFGVSVPQALAIGTLHHVIQLSTVVLFAAAFWLRDRIERARAPGDAAGRAVA